MPNEDESVFGKISGAYYSLTASEKKAADYVLAYQRETQYMSITELADACGVAEATVSRFCRRLGYKGYNAFKLAVANATAKNNPWGNPLSGEVLKVDTMEDVCRKLYTADVGAIGQTLELLNLDSIRRAADLLEKAGRVYCMGQGGSMLLAMEAAHLFSTVSGKFTAVGDAHLQAVSAVMMDSDDVILFFSYSGSTLDMVDTIRLAKERRAKVILITRFPKSPGAGAADVVLQCGANESPLQLGSVAAKIAQMFLLDVLFSEYCRRDMDACRQSRIRVADALASKHI